MDSASLIKLRLDDTSISNEDIATKLSKNTKNILVTLGGHGNYSFFTKPDNKEIGSRASSQVLHLKDGYPELLEAAREFSAPLSQKA
jgi:DUF2075 family protein